MGWAGDTPAPAPRGWVGAAVKLMWAQSLCLVMGVMGVSPPLSHLILGWKRLGNWKVKAAKCSPIRVFLTLKNKTLAGGGVGASLVSQWLRLCFHCRAKV